LTGVKGKGDIPGGGGESFANYYALGQYDFVIFVEVLSEEAIKAPA
jgi:uncharacterized protein with GYD domain